MNREIFKHQLGWHKLNEKKSCSSYDFESFAAGFLIATCVFMFMIFLVF